MQKILVTGGTGFIGTALVKSLGQAGYDPLVLSRDIHSASAQEIPPDAAGLIPAETLASLYGIINLAGETIGQRWNPAVKKEIRESRIQTTDRIVAAVRRNRQLSMPVPAVLLSASAVGYYGSRPSGALTEKAPPGTDFLAQVCHLWEQAAFAAEQENLRVVVFRLGIVLGADGGALSQMARPFRWGVGGPIGGRQHISWIHRTDLIRGFFEALQRTDMTGAYNLTSPTPVPMQQFTASLGAALGKPSWAKMPEILARLIFGEMGDSVLLADQQVLPRRLLDQGFRFSYPDLETAFAEIYPAG